MKKFFTKYEKSFQPNKILNCVTTTFYTEELLFTPKIKNGDGVRVIVLTKQVPSPRERVTLKAGGRLYRSDIGEWVDAVRRYKHVLYQIRPAFGGDVMVVGRAVGRAGGGVESGSQRVGSPMTISGTIWTDCRGIVKIFKYRRSLFSGRIEVRFLGGSGL
jgi:hypothetical protein